MGKKGNWREQGITFKVEELPYHRGDMVGREIDFEFSDENGVFVAWFLFDLILQDGKDFEPLLVVKIAEVEYEHQRKGIATYTYDLVEEMTGFFITPEEGEQTEEAKRFWESR